MYIPSYISEKSKHLKEILKDGGNENNSGAGGHEKKIMQAYSKNYEASVQEAITRVCSLKRKSWSHNVVFIPMDDDTLKMSLLTKCLETRDPNLENVWLSGLPEKYKSQTMEFESMCMADFAPNYPVVYGS